MEKEKLIPITNDMMFTLVMEDEEICRDFLAILLPDKLIGEIKVITQRSIENGAVIKGVRLDVFVKNENVWYDIEMQCTAARNLPYRSRYYHSAMDIKMIEKGAYYTDLKKSYVIFICTFDPFGEGLPVYTFRNLCEEKNTLQLGDDSFIIMINTKGACDGLSREMKDFFDYVNKMEVAEDDNFLERVHTRVVHFNESKWGGEIMTWEEKVEERVALATEQGIERGIERGIEQGIEQGEKRKTEALALKMKEKAIDIKMIAEITGLSVSEIEEL